MPPLLGDNAAVGEGDWIKVPEKCPIYDIMGDQAGAHTATMVPHMAIQGPLDRMQKR